MFGMRGTLARGRFAWAAALRVVLFVASVLLFPIFMTWFVGTNCQSVPGACGATGLIGSMIFKPLVAIVFIGSLIGICVRRVRDLGLPAWFGIAVPALFALNYNHLMMVGAPWSLALTTGTMFLGFPYELIIGLICLIALALLPGRALAPNAGAAYGWTGKAVFIVLVFVLLKGTLDLLTMPSGPLFMPMITVYSMIFDHYAMPVITTIFGGLAAWLVWQNRVPTQGPSEEISTAPERPGAKSPNGLIVVAALLVSLSFSLWAWHTTTGASLAQLVLALPLAVAPILLPTFAIYLMLFLALGRLANRRDSLSCVLAALALLPFAHWGYSHWAAGDALSNDIARAHELAPQQIPTPNALFVADGRSPAREIMSRPGFVAIYVEQRDQLQRVTFDDRQNLEHTPVTELPQQYILFRSGVDSEFRNLGRVGGGPFEFRLVGPEKDELTALWFRSQDSVPPFYLPVLSGWGWFKGSGSLTGEVISQNLAAALDEFAGNS